jgi:hypothetical protein
MSGFTNPTTTLPVQSRMRKLSVVLLILLAQFASASTRVDEIVARFNKTKHKEKRGVSTYRRVEATPLARASVSGTYRPQGLDFVLDLDARKGRDHRGAFTLRDVRLNGAHLTATKVYTNGTTATLEGVFLRQTVREGTSPANARLTSDRTGIGIVGLDFVLDGGIELDKLFYEGDMFNR